MVIGISARSDQGLC